ncbi:MAG: DUF2619 domain-containing protein [Ignavibacteriales bacterium]
MRHTSLYGVAAVRIVSGLVEILAAVYILRRGSLRTALRVNAALGLVGPVALVVATVIGAAGLKAELRPLSMALLFVGIAIIVLATR